MTTKVVVDVEYSDAELLAICNHAIAQIMATGQSYEIRGRSYAAANLQSLKTWRDDLQQRVDAASAGAGGGIVANHLNRGR
jgi:hypothetical protein